MSSSPYRTDTIVTWLAEEVKPTVDARIKRSLRGDRYHDRLWFQTRTERKHLRPGLLVLAGELCELAEPARLDTAAGVELLHTFSLIHDDLGDGDRVRQDDPWIEYDADDAVNIGDMLLAHALTLIPEAGRSLAIEAVRERAVGQQIEFELATRRDATEAEYFEMVDKKPGALFDLCLELPQTLTDTHLDIEGYSALWPAFQLRDDLLDFEAGKGDTAIGSDVRAGKRTLMAIHADDERVYDILDKPPDETTEEDVVTVQGIFEEMGSFEYVHQQMYARATEAMSSLKSLPDSPQRQRLVELCRYCTAREQ